MSPQNCVANATVTRPPGVEYRLTELGQSLIGPLADLIGWANANYAKIRQARHAFDAGAPALMAVQSR